MPSLGEGTVPVLNYFMTEDVAFNLPVVLWSRLHTLSYPCRQCPESGRNRAERRNDSVIKRGEREKERERRGGGGAGRKSE